MICTCVLLCPFADVQSEGFRRSLQQPTAFAAVDSINPDDTGRLKFHYVVVEVSRAPCIFGGALRPHEKLATAWTHHCWCSSNVRFVATCMPALSKNIQH
jgi:predicted metallopeptidase